MNYDSILSERAQAIQPSPIRRFFDMAENMEGVISLGVGEPDFRTPWTIRSAAISTLERQAIFYGANSGLLQLREEISHFMQRKYKLNYCPENELLVTIGGSEAVDLTFRTLLNPGDEVLITEPCFVCYAPLVSMADGVPVSLPTKEENEFRLTAEELKAKITPKTKLLMLSYPNNPTGAIMEKEDLEQIARVVEKHDLLVISDEIYSELIYDGHAHVSFASLSGMYPRTITINGFSKAFAMTGWRVGYACAAEEIIAVMNKIHQYAIMCAPRQGQVAALCALRTGRENGYESILSMRDSYDRRRRLMVNAFRQMGLDCFEPYGAFYVFPSVSRTGLSSEDFCSQLLQEKDVAAVPGTAFGPSGEGHIRCCYATAIDKINIALDRMADFVAHRS